MTDAAKTSRSVNVNVSLELLWFSSTETHQRTISDLNTMWGGRKGREDGVELNIGNLCILTKEGKINLSYSAKMYSGHYGKNNNRKYIN